MKSSELVSASLGTDRGCVREHNEDFVASHEPATQEEEARDGWLYILADGVGGSDGGEVASQYATEQTLYHYLAAFETADWRQRLAQAIDAANADLRLLIAEQWAGKRMATTMVAAVVHGDWATLANVGDSRGYHWRNGNMKQVTRDHSLVARLVEEGAITPEEALVHPRRNVILHSLGSESKPRIDVFDVGLNPGDRLILCSDGLTRHVSDGEISESVANEMPSESTSALISLAKDRGGEDNVSVAIISYRDETSKSIITDEAEIWSTPIGKSFVPVANRRALWVYTAVLCLIQVLLIIWTWLLVNS